MALILPGRGIINPAAYAPTPGGGFTDPTSLSNLQLWLDASDSGTITIATGVSQWNDKSGNNNHAVQATGSKQPTVNSAAQNGKDTLQFAAASSQELTLTNDIQFHLTGYTAIAVVKKANTTDRMCPFGNKTAGFAVYWDNADTLSINNFGYVKTTTGISAGANYQIICADMNAYTDNVGHVFDNSNVSQTLSDAGSGDGYIYNSVGARVGISAYTNGAIAEVIFYTGVKSSGDRASLYTYLTNKWAV